MAFFPIGVPQGQPAFNFDWLFKHNPEPDPKQSNKPVFMQSIARNLGEAEKQGMAWDFFEPSKEYGPFQNFAISAANAAVPNPVWYLNKVDKAVTAGATKAKEFIDWGMTPEKVLDQKEAERKVVEAQNSPVTNTGATTVSDKLADATNKMDIGKIYIPKEPPKIADPTYISPPVLPDPAERPERAMFDFQPYLDRMEEFRPEMDDRKTYMKDRFWGNLARALAAGASGSGHSGAGAAFARIGSSFGVQQADTTDEYLRQQQQYEDVQRQWEMNRLNLEMRLAQEANSMAFENEQVKWQSQEDQRQILMANNQAKYQALQQYTSKKEEAAQQNADRFWDYENTKGQLTQSKVLPGTGKGVIAIQHVAPDGQSHIEYRQLNDPTGGGVYDNDDLNAMQDLRDLYGEDSDQFKAALYRPIIARGDHWEWKKRMADEILRTSRISEIFNEDIEETVNAEAEKVTDQRAVTAADPDAYAKALSDAKAHQLAQYIKFDDTELMAKLIETNNYGARAWAATQKTTKPSGADQMAGAQ